jgi:hypothetical protein
MHAQVLHRHFVGMACCNLCLRFFLAANNKPDEKYDAIKENTYRSTTSASLSSVLSSTLSPSSSLSSIASSSMKWDLAFFAGALVFPLLLRNEKRSYAKLKHTPLLLVNVLLLLLLGRQLMLPFLW